MTDSVRCQVQLDYGDVWEYPKHNIQELSLIVTTLQQRSARAKIQTNIDNEQFTPSKINQ